MLARWAELSKYSPLLSHTRQSRSTLLRCTLHQLCSGVRTHLLSQLRPGFHEDQRQTFLLQQLRLRRAIFSFCCFGLRLGSERKIAFSPSTFGFLVGGGRSDITICVGGDFSPPIAPKFLPGQTAPALRGLVSLPQQFHTLSPSAARTCMLCVKAPIRHSAYFCSPPKISLFAEPIDQSASDFSASLAAFVGSGLELSQLPILAFATPKFFLTSLDN